MIDWRVIPGIVHAILVVLFIPLLIWVHDKDLNGPLVVWLRGKDKDNFTLVCVGTWLLFPMTIIYYALAEGTGGYELSNILALTMILAGVAIAALWGVCDRIYNWLVVGPKDPPAKQGKED